ncbi:6083_t:CDS:2 [Gigaspora rosea]|nr:6083_t:CDS:2 [Gigaspora rosea]
MDKSVKNTSGKALAGDTVTKTNSAKIDLKFKAYIDEASATKGNTRALTPHHHIDPRRTKHEHQGPAHYAEPQPRNGNAQLPTPKQTKQ